MKSFGLILFSPTYLFPDKLWFYEAIIYRRKSHRDKKKKKLTQWTCMGLINKNINFYFYFVLLKQFIKVETG